VSRELRPLAALALFALISLISAGCGSNAPSETGTASSSGSATSAGSAATASTAREKAVTFAECMRDSGVAEFPDPTASGDVRYGIKSGSSLDPSSPAWKRAIGACKTLEPAGLLGSKATPTEMRARLKFAQCMRDNGFKDFPGLTKDGSLIDTSKMASARGRGARSIPGFRAAAQKCQKVYTSAQGASEAQDVGADRSRGRGCGSRHRRRRAVRH
jgi:hypothetical protein